MNLPKRVDEYIWQRGVNPAAYVGLAQPSDWKGTLAQAAEAKRHFFVNRDRAFGVPSRSTAWAIVDVDNDGTGESVWHDGRKVF